MTDEELTDTIAGKLFAYIRNYRNIEDFIIKDFKGCKEGLLYTDDMKLYGETADMLLDYLRPIIARDVLEWYVPYREASFYHPKEFDDLVRDYLAERGAK